jgi:glycosyltransferase involved in cell wall biosynthesis
MSRTPYHQRMMQSLVQNEGVGRGICWITVRRKKDLCSTTVFALAKGLVDSGHRLTLLNPDTKQDHIDQLWNQHELFQSKKKGFHASSLASSAIRWLKDNENSDFDVYLIDWQVAKRIVPYLRTKKKRMILMDRSPPADASFLGKLQWSHWKNAWRYVSNGVIERGCVVSPPHKEFVLSKYTFSKDRIHVLPAGVDLERFKIQKKRDSKEMLQFIYHGRLDKHRGVLALPIFIQKLLTVGIKAQLTLVGEGNALNSLLDMEKNCSWLIVHSKMEQKELANLLSKQHIGFLPMPRSKVWNLASPLKRSEYLASGLLVLGINHDGHVLENTDSSWYKLISQENFHDLGIDWVKSLDGVSMEKGFMEARKYSELNCSWDKTVDELESAINFNHSNDTIPSTSSK